MIDRVRWGVLGAARIAVRKVIPAMQRGQWSQVWAIGSRDHDKAKAAAAELGIEKAYGSYDEVLLDSDVEAVYIPLPNHLHVPWAIKAARAGKHVLCEKPIALTAREASLLLRVRDETGMKVQEAFMIRTHPQWIAARDVIASGRIGEVRAVVSAFSYFNQDPANIRNIVDWGGGGLMDIGCYLIHISRLIFQEEPRRVIGLIERESQTEVDVLTSAILDFTTGQSVFTCGTRMVPHQRVEILGASGLIEIEVPFGAPPDRSTRILVSEGFDIFGPVDVLEFAPCNQFTIQGDLFSRAIREGGEPPLPLEDSVNNMAVIEAVIRSAKRGLWEAPEYDQGFTK
jgi:predicted dehydrogenase